MQPTKVTNKFKSRHSSVKPKSQVNDGEHAVGGGYNQSSNGQANQNQLSRNAQRQVHGSGQNSSFNQYNGNASNTPQNGPGAQESKSNGRQNRVNNQTLDPASQYEPVKRSNNTAGRDQNQGHEFANGGLIQNFQRPANMVPSNQHSGKDGSPLYTLTNTQLHQNKYNSAGRAHSDLRGGRIGVSPGSQGQNVKPQNSLIGVNGQFGKRAPSTGRNGNEPHEISFQGNDAPHSMNNSLNNGNLKDNIYKGQGKRSQSVERAAAIHSSGTPGLNSLSRGNNMVGGLDSFSTGMNPQMAQNPNNFGHSLNGAYMHDVQQINQGGGLQDINGGYHKKNSKSYGNYQGNQLIDNNYNNTHGPTTGSVQTQRKRRSIMHDNLTNSRGTQRIQNNGHAANNLQYEYEMGQQFGTQQQSNNRGGIGMQSPPSIPGGIRSNNGFQKQNDSVLMNYQNQMMNPQGQAEGPENKHFMQDAIERKIEKFQSQNMNVQKRVNTSSKFRNNNHMIMGSLGSTQISSHHGPGTSGGQGTTSSSLGGISKKKYSLNSGQEQQLGMLNNSNVQDSPFYSGHMGAQQQQLGPMTMKNQQLKRPNTIANKHAHSNMNGGQKVQANTQQFDLNGMKMNIDKDSNNPQGGVMAPFGAQDRQQQSGDNRQVNQKNMNEIYDMLEKYAQNKGDNTQDGQNPAQNRSPPVISKDNIVFNSQKQHHNNNGIVSPQNKREQQDQQAYANTSGKKSAPKHLQNKFQQLQANSQSLQQPNSNPYNQGPNNFQAGAQGQNQNGGPNTIQPRNLQKNLAKVKLNKIYDNRFFQNNQNSLQQQQQQQNNIRQQSNPHQQVPQIQGQGSQGDQGGQRSSGNPSSHKKQPQPQMTLDDELSGASRMRIHVQSSSTNQRTKEEANDYNQSQNRHRSKNRNQSQKPGSEAQSPLGPKTQNYSMSPNVTSNKAKSGQKGGLSSGQNNKYDSDEEESPLGVNMLKSVTDQQFIIKGGSKNGDKNSYSQNGGNQSSRSYDSSDQKQTKKEMIRFLSRILDRNKPLFVFNTRLNADDEDQGAGTPSFSVITLIHEND